MNWCSECAGPLTDLFYGYGDCGSHERDDYEKVQGYRIDPVDGFGDWDGGPSWLFVALDRMPAQSEFYMTKKRCCGRVDLDDPDETDYCPKCKDVMEPMSEAGRKLLTYAMLGQGVADETSPGGAT